MECEELLRRTRTALRAFALYRELLHETIHPGGSEVEVVESEFGPLAGPNLLFAFQALDAAMEDLGEEANAPAVVGDSELVSVNGREKDE